MSVFIRDYVLILCNKSRHEQQQTLFTTACPQVNQLCEEIVTLCSQGSMAEVHATPRVELPSWQRAQAEAIQSKTKTFNNGHNEDRSPMKQASAEVVLESIVEPSASRILPRPTSTPSAQPGNGLWICEKDGTKFACHRHLVRHKMLIPGHDEYAGPAVCVCGAKFRREDGRIRHFRKWCPLRPK